MTNDIKGANNMNLDSVLICSGVHRHDLEINIGDMPVEKNLLKLYEKHSLKPTFVVSLLKDIISNA
jgi:ribonucleotide monophosphatase NagD (HAD superfamily)